VRLRSVATWPLLTLAVIACIGVTPTPSAVESTPTTSIVPSPVGSVVPSPTAFLTPSPSPTSGASASAFPSPTPFDPALEALLPTEIGGVATVRGSGLLTDFGGGSDFCFSLICPWEAGKFTAALGTASREMHVALAYVEKIDHSVVVIAYRGGGLAGAELLRTRLAALSSDPEQPRAFPVSVSGKSVTWAAYGVRLNWQTTDYLYATSDVLYSIRYNPAEEFPTVWPPPTPPEVTAAIEALR
jgi:hypothetical protein